MAHRITLLAGLMLASGLIAASLPAAAEPGCGPMGGDRWEHMGQRMQQRQQSLHDTLKLTPEQEGAWKKYTESMPWTAAKGEPRPGPDDWARLTAPERAERMLDLSKQRQERMAEHVAALKSFYAVLSPEQKKAFDEHHAGPRHGHRHGPRRGPAAPGANPPPAPAAKG